LVFCGKESFEHLAEDGMTSNRTTLAKRFLQKVAPAASLETVAFDGEVDRMAETFRLPDQERELVRTTARKIAGDAELAPLEQFALEAIIIPDKRPVIDVVGGDFQVIHPLWLQFGTDPIKTQIRNALPSIGRLEVSGIPSLPYGGTSFVVAPSVIMTNRHVAELVGSGVGLRGLEFRPGLGAGVDFKRERGSEESQHLQVNAVLMIHPFWVQKSEQTGT
jgi:hypothetical protein